VTSAERRPGGADAVPPLVCSARGCRAAATSGLLWNNPRLHDHERRKVWLACEEHVPTLGDFLSMRGFLRDTVPVAGLPGAVGRADERRLP
jgi:hypothetical protein